MKQLDLNWQELAKKINQNRTYLVAIWCLLALILVVGVFSIGLRSVGGAEKIITIKEGEGRAAIATQLKNEGVIRSRIHFLLLAHALGAQVKPGVYNINPNNSSYAILHALRIGQFALTKITIPEGWRREQIAALLTKEGYKGEEFLTKTVDLEGYLFPDTYYLKKDVSTDDIVSQFREAFNTKTNDIKPTKEQIILASIVERESGSDSDRALIAGIYAHRIKIGKALEADPTVQFAKYNNAKAAGLSPEDIWPRITMDDYQSVTSPYNTYLIPAYPPGPICNPGLESIKAALNPTPTDDIFFFHTSDGKIMTSKTYEEHRAKVQRFL